jgi:hypothetical protein
MLLIILLMSKQHQLLAPPIPAPATPGTFTIDFGTTFQSGDFEFNPQYKQTKKYFYLLL